MELWQLGVLTIMGVVSGWLNVMAGGGSLLTVPVMIFMGVPAPVANGTNRIGILTQNIAALTNFRRKGLREWRLALSLSAVASVGAGAGAQLGVRFDGPWFNALLALVMLAVLVLMITGTGTRSTPDEAAIPRSRLVAGHILMLGAGFWGGLIQIGVGFILIPILNRVLGMGLVRVNFYKVFIILVYTVVAMVVYATQVQILWIAGACLAAGSALGGWVGAHSTVRHGERWIRPVLYTTLVAFIIKLVWPE
ncbi:MAG: sulfite exporter TauE/SafE family protein [Chromatiales bacterium]|nr:sulfite exporter TauE/SafE family protein [Chromatiales bacterium]